MTRPLASIGDRFTAQFIDGLAAISIGAGLFYLAKVLGWPLEKLRIVPLIMFTADRRKMGALVAPRWMTMLAVIIATILIALNVKLLWDLFAAL